ncbi:exported protein of unknown function [Nitrosopumilus adriaticus]|uniref:Uncharacterized protein n=2 Tax=Nitrosopumilus adriaticus TaxID=1580092 RepID=A0A0D5C2X4_9ARCH|nr:exported protein of unknown function [Nitrosopumilus adriaticus]
MGGMEKLIGTSLPILFTILFLINTPNVNAQSVEEFGFDQHPYVVSSATPTHGGLMYYNFDLAGNGNPNDSKVAQIISSCYSEPFPVFLNETSGLDDGWLYSKRINFVDTLCPNPNSTPPSTTNVDFDMHVDPTSTDPLQANLTTSVFLTDSSDIVPPSLSGLQWSPKKSDGNYAVCVNDVDNDAICDEFENNVSHLEINYPPGTSIYKLNDTTSLGNCDYFALIDSSVPCSGSDKKDLWIEFDYMESFPLNDDALKDVRESFWKHDIRVHFIVDEAIPNQEYLKPGGVNHFRFFGTDQVKSFYFGTPTERDALDWNSLGWKQKKQVFHYGLSIDKQKGAPTTSGFAEKLGNDFGISYGGWPSGVPTHSAYQSGTIMHEIGHNLGLDHGGDYADPLNCKPNYVSVMSYSRQLPTIYAQPLIDFSNATIQSLDETQLSEINGIGNLPDEYSDGVVIVYGPTPEYIEITENNQDIDWNQDGSIEQSPVQAEINYLIDEGCGLVEYTSLSGHNDWESLNFDSRGTGNWVDGRMTSPCKYDPKDEGKSNSCKSDNPYHGNPMGKNILSKYADTKNKKDFIPNWNERVWFGGAEEFTSELAREHFLANAKIINNTFQNLPDESFIDDPKSIKEIYKKSIKKVVSLIEQHEYVQSAEELESLLGTIDGENGDDLIKSDFTTKPIKQLKNSISTQESLGSGGIILYKNKVSKCEKDEVSDNSGLCFKKSELCKPNQILDETGVCVPKGNFCGSGTVYKDGVCLMEGKSPGKQDLSIVYGSIGAVIASIAFAVFMASKYTSLKSKISK